MKIKKADIVLAVIITILGVTSSIYLFLYSNQEIENANVIIHVDNKIYGTYPLNEDRVIEINHKNHINKITIKDGNAQMTFSDCYNQDCVKQGKIKDKSKNIVCLPNKVLVEIDSQESQFDAIAN